MDRRLRFSLLGHPVRHSLSPVLHVTAMRAMGLPHVYSAVDVASVNSLRRLVQEIRRGTLAGANVTAPYKRAVLDMVDEATPIAQEVGAANLLLRSPGGRVVADNTDVEALVSVLERLAPRKTRAAVIGAGGAGLAAVAACKRFGIAVVGVTTRSWSDSSATHETATAEQVRALGGLTSPWPSLTSAALPTGKASQVLRLQWTELAARADLVIQATSAGSVSGDPGESVVSIVPWAQLPKHAVALDVVYRPTETPFLRTAASKGLRTENGLSMLIRQAELSVMRWLGFEPPEGVMRGAAERALASGGTDEDRP
jgi:shikimate dehydrogenase